MCYIIYGAVACEYFANVYIPECEGSQKVLLVLLSSSPNSSYS
jgi:hypothetical protein